jgi:hypothetical protein
MHRRLIAVAIISVFCLSAMSLEARATVIVGLPADPVGGNSFPFGSAYGNGGTAEYQQVYSASEFPGTITITALEFYNTQFNSGATEMNSGNWTISLSTTSADWNTISGTFASNIGADNTTVFSGDLSQPWTYGNTLVINLTTPFTFNPGAGNLLLDVVVSGASKPGGNLYFDVNGYNGGNFNGNTIMGRVYSFGNATGNVDNGYGLVTGFQTDTPAIPEPSGIVLLGLGGIGMGLAAWQRRRLAVA